MKTTLFIGCVESSYVLLEAMLEKGYKVDGIITMESSAINSDFKSLVPLAEKYGIDYICTKNVNDEETVGFAKSKAPDVIYCFGWSRLIGRELLALPKYGVVGFHPAALPCNKGRHPLIWALVLGLKKTASTFFIMDEGADTGDIISQREVIIDETDDAQDLYDKVLEVAKEQVLTFTKEFAEDAVKPVKQDPKAGNAWRKRGRMDGQIDWRMSGRAIYNLVRGLTHPYVGAHFMAGDKEVKVWKCEYELTDEYENLEPGKVLKVNSQTDFVIKAYDGIVHIIDSDAVSLKEGDYL
ncbi:methionyl-tRNA formyltransferase [Butyrivibrio fibrisolvens]|uniref:formyltransferase family protein n=1 Tax=Pseudobutyrivibrio ruminis TaxID=46206 RepID=UPI00041DF1E9|nr:formyltransferase family protein [Pseudobutyrivibrio ruminis]MDC7278872.1 methionyl-tRNA formyltransferase [Butyrivibrio fibrisolvens]